MRQIKVTTAAGTNASKIGEAYCYEGVTWLHSVDACDSDGGGRVFLNCDDDATAEYVAEQLEADDRVVSYQTL